MCVAGGNEEVLVANKRKWIVLAAVLAGPILLAQTAPPATPSPATPSNDSESADAPASAPGNSTSETVSTTHHKLRKVSPLPVVLPPMPSGPLSQMPMDQIPPTPAKVTYQGGLLTIFAENSTLGEILREVHKLTGAAVEYPLGSSGSSEHVVTHLGPAAPRDVLAGLLNGSSFNYVMLGSNADPKAVSSVILTPKEPVAGETQTASNVFQQPNQPPMPPNRFPGRQPFNPQGAAPMPGNGVTPPSEDDASADEPDPADNADDQTQPTQQVQPVPNEANEGNNQAQPADPSQPNAGPKTPEQILEMLRRPQQPGAAAPPPQPPPQQ
jgi:hypothetical protein